MNVAGAVGADLAPREWPYLTADVPPVAGVIRRYYEDFVVDEISLYEPEGHGDHTFFRIEKAGLSTMKAVSDIARALGVRPREIGVAGLKDAHAVTRQTLSVEHVDPARVLALELPRIRVLSATRHPRKLRTGHLAGNRFRIRVRDVDPARLADVRRVLAVLARRGVPNYFGPQRFGRRGDTAAVGRALVRARWDDAVALIAGRPMAADTGEVRLARERFDAGDYDGAAPLWPPAYRHVARLCRAMARSRGDARRALHAIERRMLRFYVSAYQSWLFNEVLARRVDELDRVRTGDLAYRHDTGGVFLIEDEAAEQPRAERFEISATGPLPGPGMRVPEGWPAAVERDVLERAGARLDEFPATGPFRAPGTRRPLRFPIGEAEVESGTDDDGAYFEFRFTLPPGAYATAVLREVGKDRITTAREDGDGVATGG